jgi:hypothetical protein
MPARRRHYPGRAPLTGLAGTREAYDLCVSCGHARIMHTTTVPLICTATTLYPAQPSPAGQGTIPGPCPCAGFTGAGDE